MGWANVRFPFNDSKYYSSALPLPYRDQKFFGVLKILNTNLAKKSEVENNTACI